MIRLKNLIREDVIGEFSEGIDIFRNPKSISRMAYDLRGISTPTGELFVVDSNRVIHYSLAKWLKNNYLQGNIPEFHESGDFIKGIETGYIPWMRRGTSNDFYLSETYGSFKFNMLELIPHVNKYIPKIKLKNSQYTFIAKSISVTWK